MLLETDDQETTTRDDPQALIEEARQLQRERARRRTIVSLPSRLVASPRWAVCVAIRRRGVRSVAGSRCIGGCSQPSPTSSCHV